MRCEAVKKEMRMGPVLDKELRTVIDCQKIDDTINNQVYIPMYSVQHTVSTDGCSN
jgi:hypothetical protein